MHLKRTQPCNLLIPVACHIGASVSMKSRADCLRFSTRHPTTSRRIGLAATRIRVLLSTSRLYQNEFLDPAKIAPPLYVRRQAVYETSRTSARTRNRSSDLMSLLSAARMPFSVGTLKCRSLPKVAPAARRFQYMKMPTARVYTSWASKTSIWWQINDGCVTYA